MNEKHKVISILQVTAAQLVTVATILYSSSKCSTKGILHKYICKTKANLQLQVMKCIALIICYDLWTCFV